MNNNGESLRKFALRPIALGVMLACGGGAWANPTGPQVAAGAASFASKGATLTVTNAPGTIINWQAFSIGGGEHTRFQQQSVASAVLNRVVGADASSILGSLTSNGRVFLVNPHGIVFGAGARIDTAAFIASTLNMADGDFLAGRFKFEGGGHGILRNEGQIRASGDIMLVGPAIENTGLIRSETGNVLLAAGKSVTITSPDSQGVKFALQAPTDSAINLGTIEAGNAAAVFAGTLVHSGDIRAMTASLDGGTVVLVAQKEAIVQSGGVISASGAKGGDVTVQSGDLTSVAGHIDAKGSAAQGGTVRVLGNRVAVQSGASVDASGETGGGTILVGGDYQGKNPDLQNAWRTYIGADSTLRADAVTSGDGGKVIVWADDSTRFHGNISARGGAQSGDGGFVETSGKNSLTVSGAFVDTRAPAGHSGMWLLDPVIAVVQSGGTHTREDVDEFADPLAVAIIDPTAINGAASPVTIQAHSDIQFESDIQMTVDGVGLTAQAGRSILVNADIRTTNGEVRLTANDTAPGIDPVLRGPNRAELSMADGMTIDALAGNVLLQMGQSNALVPDSGDITVALVNGNDVSVSHRGLTPGGRILRSSGTSLITAANSVHLQNAAPGGAASIGLATDRIRIETPRLEAQTFSGTGGIFIDSPNAGALTIGGVPNSIYSGLERGVQTVDGGDIRISVNGDLVRLPGGLASCGATGGSGGPVCANSGDITLAAAAIGTDGAGGRIYIDAGTGNVSTTTTGGGIFLRERLGDAQLSRYSFAAPAGQTIELANLDGNIAVDTSVTLPLNPLSLVTGSGNVNFTGPITIEAASLTLAGTGAALFNSGTVGLDAPTTIGQPVSIGGGTVNFNATSTISGLVTISSGTLGGTGAVAANGALTLTGGTITGTGGITVGGATSINSGSVILDGALTANGAFSATGTALTLSSAGMLTLNGANDNVITGGTVENNGTFNLAGSGALRLNGGAVFNNPGFFDIQSDAAVLHTAGAGASFTNSGILMKSGGAGTSAFGAGSLAFTNTGAGTINVFSGTLAFDPASFTTNNGTISIFPGATLATGALTNAVDATIGGTGTLDLGVDSGGAPRTLTNNGILNPGLSGGLAGTLAITGNLTQGATGTVQIDLSGTAPGSFDVLAVSGHAALDGTLNVAHVGEFTPPSDTTFNVITGFATSSGDFATVTVPDLYTPFYTAAPGAGAYVLSLGDIVNAWTAGTGAWETGANWSLNHRPTAGEDVLIDVGGASVTETVTISSGDQFARRITSAENLSISGGEVVFGPLEPVIGAAFNFNISGGAITLAGPVTANTITVSNGSVTAAAALTANTITLSGGNLDVISGTLPRLTMTGGSLTRSTDGDLTIAGPFAASGGFIAPSAGVGGFVTAGSSTITTADPTAPLTTSRNWSNSGFLNLNGELRLSGANFTNAAGGTLNMGLASLMDLAGAQLTNQGTLNINAADANQTPFGAAQGGPIVNTGTINKNLGGFVNLVHPFTNAVGADRGLVNVDGGTLSVAFGGLQGGRIEVGAGAQLNTDGAFTNLSGGVIGGRGTINVFGSTLTNEGSLRPGLAGGGGVLTVDGSVVNNGSLDVVLGGQAPNEFGRLHVTGTATLDGSLNLSTLPGYTAPDGDTFTILSAANPIVGDFGSLNTTPALANGVYFLKQPSFHLLGLGGPNVNSWFSDASGNWNDATRWSRQVVPNSPLAQAFITRPTDIQVTIPAGNFEVASLQSSETIFLNGTLSLAGASVVNGTLQINAGGVLQGAGPVTLTGLSLNGTIASTGGVTVTGITGVNNASQISGTLTANDFRMVNGGSLAIAAGGVLNLQGGATKTLGDGTLNRPVINNAGTITLAGNDLSMNGANLNIAAGTGRFEFRDNSDVVFTGGPLSTISNNGTIAKTGGAATSTIGAGMALNANGIFDAQTGTLDLAAINTFNDGTQFIGAGVNAVTGNSTFIGSITSNGLTLQSGLFGGNATFAGTTTWTGGTMTGTFSVPNGATLNLTGAVAKSVDGAGASLANSGTMSIADAGSFTLSAGASFTNNANGTATWTGAGGSATINPGSTFTNNGIVGLNATGIAGAGVFQNNLTVNSTATPTVNTVVSSTFNNLGVVNVDGGTLRLTGSGTDNGIYAIDGGTTLDIGGGTRGFDGALALSGTGAIRLSGGTLDVRTGTLPRLDLAGGTLTRSNAGNLTIAGAFNVSGGSVGAAGADDGRLVTAGVTTVTGSLGLSRDWTNTGVMNLNAGQVNPSPGAALQFANDGTLNIATSNGQPFGTAADASIANRSTLNKSSAAVADLVAAFSNTGTVNVDGGTLRLSGNGTDTGLYAIDAGTTLDFGGGTRNLNAGSNVTGAGIAAMSGATVNVNAGYSPVTTTISGGSANFNGAASQATNTLNLTGGVLGGTGNLTVLTGGTWTGGSLAGAAATLTIADGAIFAVTGANSKVVAGASIVNAGTVNLTGSGNLVLNNGATFGNAGTFDVQSNADVQNTAGAATFANTGTLRKSGGAGTSIVGANLVLTNAEGATIDVQTGTLRVNGAFATNSGTLNIESGATFSTGGAALANAGTVRGAGTLDLMGATFTNNAIVAPGAVTDPTGTLAIGGNFVQGAAGRADIELGGTGSGQFDALTVTGSAALDGTLALSTTGAYAPASGDAFEILTAGTRTGNFATTTKTFANEVVPTYGATNLSLRLGPTTSNTWILDVSDTWDSAQRWSQGRAPIATDQVVIDRPAGLFTITVPAGAFSADTLMSNENLTIAGTLALAKASSVNATLAVNGGTLQGAGPVTATTLSLDGGTIGGTGGVTVIGVTGVSGALSQVTSSLTTDGLAVTGAGLTIAGGGVLNLAGALPKSVTGSTLTSLGTVNMAGGGDTTLTGGGIWDNSGVINLGGGARIVLAGDGAATLLNRGTGVINDTSTNATPVTTAGATRAGKLFANAGTFTKAVGSADVQTLAVPLTNTGEIEVLIGTLIADGFPANSGIIELAPGTTFSTAGQPLTNNALGLLKGNGTVAASVFTNNGTVAPGDSPGTLTIAGDYVQGPAGTLAIELGGSVPGTDFDVMNVTGSATLDGTLVVTRTAGVPIVEGSAFEFMTYASRTGDFSGFAVPSGFAFQTAPGPTSYTLSNTVAVPPEQLAALAEVSQKDAIVMNDRVLVTQTPDNTDADAERRALRECK